MSLKLLNFFIVDNLIKKFLFNIPFKITQLNISSFKHNVLLNKLKKMVNKSKISILKIKVLYKFIVDKISTFFLLFLHSNHTSLKSKRTYKVGCSIIEPDLTFSNFSNFVYYNENL